jgi:hypothetical protein
MCLFVIFAIILFMSNKSGSQGGYSGSPGDKNALCTNCHSGTATGSSGIITTDIPVSGYVPGFKYTVTVTASDPLAARFGFELTAEDAGGLKTGTFSITNASETKLTNNSKAVTHTSSGVTPSGNQKVWSFEWTAPSVNAGEIIFFAAVNAANGNGSTSGDKIYKTSLSIQALSTGKSDFRSGISVYPNPANDNLNIAIGEKFSNLNIELVNSLGLVVIQKHYIERNTTLNVAELPRGVYYLRIFENGKIEVESVILF